MIAVLSTPQAALKWCHRRRAEAKKIGFVATMGALHAGHLSLVQRAVAENDCCCASIFINPLQFNDARDLHNYPTDFTRDTEQLAAAGCDMVFSGELPDFFPELALDEAIPYLEPGPTAHGLEGEYRPGHLQGVVTIVDRLFHTIGHCTAYFGEKDFQQVLVIQDLARRLRATTMIDIRMCPTRRDENGLALSSRNQQLTEAQTIIATRISRALQAAKLGWQRGLRQPAALTKLMLCPLTHPAIHLEYAAIRDQAHWTAAPPTAPIRQPRALIAVRLGGVRLIDTLALATHS